MIHFLDTTQLFAEHYSKPKWAHTWKEGCQEGHVAVTILLPPDAPLYAEKTFIIDVLNYIETTSPGHIRNKFGADLDVVAATITSHILLQFPKLLDSYRQVVRPLAAARDENDDFWKLLASHYIEEDFHRFFVDHPRFLSLFAIEARSKLPLGAEFVTDFVIFETGELSNFVEIEPPGLKLLTKKGTQAAELTQSLEQISSWRSWLRQNTDYFRNRFPLYRPGREKFTLIGGRLPNDGAAWQRIQDSERQRGIDLLTYDEIGDRLSIARSMLFASRRQISSTDCPLLKLCSLSNQNGCALDI